MLFCLFIVEGGRGEDGVFGADVPMFGGGRGGVVGTADAGMWSGVE